MAQFGLSAYPRFLTRGNSEYQRRSVVQSNGRGYITYAMAGPNTRTTQVFINYGNNQRLPGRIRGLWQVTEGMDVVDKLYGVMAKARRESRSRSGLIGTRGKAYLQQNSLIWTRSRARH